MRASFSPQSELGPALMGLAPACALATHCTGHCSMSVAQGIKGPCGFDVILTFLPQKRAVLCDTYNTQQGLRSLPHLREHFKTRADDHIAPLLLMVWTIPSAHIMSYVRGRRFNPDVMSGL